MIGYLTQNHALIHAFQQPRAAATVTRRKVDNISNRVFKVAPKLSDYISENEAIAVKGTLDRPISGLVMDSRRVVPGTLFFALPGLRADGAGFIDEAVNRGAVAIVTQKIPTPAPRSRPSPAGSTSSPIVMSRSSASPAPTARPPSPTSSSTCSTTARVSV